MDIAYTFNDTIPNSDFYNNETESEKEKFEVNYTHRRIEFIIFFVASRMCDILNCWTIAVIFQPKKIRRVNYLIANLSIACILLSIITTFYMGDYSSVLPNLKGVYLCKIMSFLRNILVTVISLNVLAISYERIRSFQYHVGELLIKRTLIAIWGVSIFTMLPTILTRVYIHNPPDQPKCKKVALFGIVELSIIYEIVRFFIFHASVCAYMIFELYKLRSKMKYLYIFRSIQKSANLLKKIQKVRFVYIFSISFIFVWFPTGIILFLISIQHRQPTSTVTPKFDLTIPLVITVYLYLMVVPIIILLTNEDMSKINFGSRRSVNNVPEEKGSRNKKTGVFSASMNQNETFALTSCDNNDSRLVVASNQMLYPLFDKDIIAERPPQSRDSLLLCSSKDSVV